MTLDTEATTVNTQTASAPSAQAANPSAQPTTPSAQLATPIRTTPSVTLSIQNTGDQIIRCDIPRANFYEFISANSIEPVNLELCQTYNIKLTKGRFVKNTNYTPSSDGATLDIERYYL